MKDDTINEQLSSLMDGELAPDTARFLSKRLANDPAMAATWERWHAMRDSLRQQGTLAPVDFCARVRDAIEAEETVRQAPARDYRIWRGLAGGAIAAGVAAVAMMAARPTALPEAPAPIAQAELAHVAPVTTSDLTPNWRLSPVADRQSYVLAQPQLSEEFDSYFVGHGLASGSSGTLGVVSYVPVVATPATRATDESLNAGKCRTLKC